MVLNTRLIALSIFVSSAVTAFGTDFDEIIRNPTRFDNKRVTLVAMVEGGAVERFYLYQPPEPKIGRDDAREIYGLISAEGPLYERYNKKWVRVTGVIDASYRGLFSKNACSLHIERVRPIGKVEKPKLRCGSSSCLEIKFSQLLKDPNSYEHKCVCVKGFAHVRGDVFVIYESEKAADGGDHPDFTKGVFVSQEVNAADYDHYNKHWIEIRGIVDLNERGFADYPAGIAAEDVQPALPGK